MTALIASIAATSPTKMLSEALLAIERGADMVELRLDALQGHPAKLLNHLAEVGGERCLITLRSISEGGQSPLSFCERATILRDYAEAGAAFIDIEGETLIEAGRATSHGLLAQASHEGQSGIILSTHSFEPRPINLESTISQLGDYGERTVAKIAFNCTDITQNIEALDLMRRTPEARIIICMGEKGVMSRVLAKRSSAFGTFCSPDSGNATAPGQVSLADMLQMYGFRRQNEDTELFGVIGSPVAHSIGPSLFNALFQSDNYNGVYLPLRIDNRDELFRFLSACQTTKWLNAKGFSVTVPHKEAALEWIGHRADPLAQRIGATNTLLFDGADTKAFNTDLLGATKAIQEAIGKRLSSLSVAVLGAGGVARAIVAGLHDHVCKITIFNRNQDRASLLASEFGCDSQPWAKRVDTEADIVINCTSLGMSPNIDASPLPAGALDSGQIIFDTVYNPLRTRLLRDAQTRGCQTIDGLSMYIHQAAEQYRVWTGLSPNLVLMRRFALGKLQSQASPQEH